MKNSICVFGSGAWGTAIANVLAENDYEVCIYGVELSEVLDINDNHKNKKYFGNYYSVSENIFATTNFESAVKNKSIFVFAVPSFAISEIINNLIPHITENTIIVNLAKGFDGKSKKTLGQYTRDLLPYRFRKNVVSLLGPSYAVEVAEKQFTAITVSGYEFSVVKEVQKIFTNNYFHLYANNDPIGSEYCAALKNVIALACGISDGLGYKVNTKAALITRGLAEIVRFVTFFGGSEKTCYGLVGVGDLYLTCSSKTSRNYSAGFIIGQTSYREFINSNWKTVEGISACKIAYETASENNIYAPIICAVNNIINNNVDCKIEAEKLKRLAIGNE